MLKDTVFAAETFVNVAHHVGLEFVQQGIQHTLRDLMVHKLQRGVLPRDLQVVDELVDIDATINNFHLHAFNVIFQLFYQRSILEVGVPRQSDGDSQLLARVLDVLLAGDREGIHDIFVHEEVLLDNPPLCLRSLLMDHLGLIDSLLKVFTKEHEHIIGSITLLGHIDHEDDVLLG